mgnify:FL=1
MAYVKYKTKDYAEGQLLAGIWTGAVSCVLNAWQGARFPSLTASQYFIWTLEKRTGTTVTSKERVLVSARSTDTLTFTRSFGGDTAIAFSANDYFCLHCNSDIIIDIQDEVTRLESAKLNSAGWLRTALTAWRTYYSNGSWAETALAFGTSGQVFTSQWASSAPIWTNPPLDINAQTAVVPVSLDTFPFYDISGVANAKSVLVALASILGIYGDWSDWNVTISGTVTLTKDMYYNDLSIPASQILDPAWYRIFVKGTMSGTGTIRRNWNNGWNASAGTWGTAPTTLWQWTLNAELAWTAWPNGVSSSSNWTNWSSTASSPSLVNTNGANGWAGGNVSGQTGGTSTWWVATRWARYLNIFYTLMLHPATWPSAPAWLGYKSTPSWASWWAWANASGTSGLSWGGGASGWNGGLIWIACYNWNFTGTVSAVWGTWWNGGNSATTGWGGWGWGWWGAWWSGWVLFRIYSVLTADATITLTGWAWGVKWTGTWWSALDWNNWSTGTTWTTISVVI